jgi:nitronate monooxygenase
LVQEIREWFDGPLLLAGSIATGSAILAAQAMGADLAYIGSPFVATAEARASQVYKQMIVDSTMDDIVYTNLFSGVHGNYLKPSIEAAGLDPDGDSKSKAWKDIWSCGQGIGAVKDIPPAGQRVAELAQQYDEAKARIEALD